MITEHTPTPWDLAMGRDDNGNHWIDHIEPDRDEANFNILRIAHGDDVAEPQREANAAFIVRAVNTHDDLEMAVKNLGRTLAVLQSRNDALVKALGDATAMLMIIRDGGSFASDEYWERLEAQTAALRLAKGSQS